MISGDIKEAVELPIELVEFEARVGVDEDAAAAAAARFALLRFPGTLPILEMAKTHPRLRFAQR